MLGKVVPHLPFRTRCLPQAVAAQWMLRRRGVRSRLVFGVRRGAEGSGQLEFHAWLMVGGECVVGGQEIGSYTAFPPFAATRVRASRKHASQQASVHSRPGRDALGPKMPLIEHGGLGEGQLNGPAGCSEAASLPHAPHRPVDALFAGLRAALGIGRHEENLAALERVDDWDAVARLAMRNRVVLLVTRGLRNSGADSPQAEAALGPLRQHAIQRGLSQLAGLRQAVDCLSGQGIDSLVLKGLPLSARLFGSPLERECHDIDLLVPSPTAADALMRGGWDRSEPSFKPTPARDRYYDRYVKDRVLVGPGGALEVHHRLVNNPFLYPVRFQELRAAGVQVQVGGSLHSTLGDSDLLAYLCVHGQMHRWSRLKWLCDVAALLASVGEEGFLNAVEQGRRRGLRPGPAFGTAMRLCREALHMELPAAAMSLAYGGGIHRQIRKTQRLWNRKGGGRGLHGIARRIDLMGTALAINPSWRGAAHELARLLAAPNDLDRVNLPDWVFRLRVPLRPVLWPADRGRRAATSLPHTTQRPKPN